MDELTRRFKFAEKSSSGIGFTSELNVQPQRREEAEDAGTSDQSDLGPVEEDSDEIHFAQQLLEPKINYEF